jgi:hypothetical protein
MKLGGFPNASVVAWSFVLNPPLLRPRASAWPSFFGSGAVRMRPHHRAIDHGVFVISVGGQVFKKMLPHTTFSPTAEPCVNGFPCTTTLRSIAPRYSCAIAIEDGFDKPAVVFGRDTDGVGSPRHKGLTSAPLVIAQRLASRYSLAPSVRPTRDASHMTPLVNPLIEDTP